jgi:hypothetical protein
MSGGAVKVPGVSMTFDGTAYVVPPLNAAAVKQYRGEVAAFFVGAVPDIEVVVKLLHAALVRNYPALTAEQVEQWVDYGNMLDIMDAVMQTSGLAAKVGELSRRIQSAMNPTAAATPASTT